MGATPASLLRLTPAATRPRLSDRFGVGCVGASMKKDVTSMDGGKLAQGASGTLPGGSPTVATLVSVNVGRPKDVEWRGQTVHTGIWKQSMPGPHRVGRVNIDGDGQGDLLGHGGEQRAVLVYQLDSYRHWQEHLGRNDFTYGQFGENLTVDGLPDDEVCIGDRYRIGTAEFEVTQPRVTCYRVGLRMGEPRMAALLVNHHRPGFYLRVLTEGHIQAGDPIVRTKAGPGTVSICEADALLYLPEPSRERLGVALANPALSPGWQASFQDLLSGTTTDGRDGNRALGLAWTGFRELRVAAVTAETPTVTSIELEAEDETPLPPARPGQYVTLRLPDAGRPPPVRSYSLSSAPGAPRYRISVKREPHGVVSGYLHDHLRAGTVVEVAAPRGEFVLTDGKSPVLLISAGIGVTPVLAMLYALVQQDTDRETWWLHATRNEADNALTRDVDDLVPRLALARVHVFYSAPQGDVSGATGAEVGRLGPATLARLRLPSDATAYLCGPAGFMTDVASALSAAGLDPAHVRTEAFTTQEAITPGLVPRARVAPHQPESGADASGPTVTFARSGLSTGFDDRWNSLLELAEACDVPTRWICRSGVCQTCRTPLLTGVVRYIDDPLQPPPPDEVLICSARPESDVVLDL